MRSLPHLREIRCGRCRSEQLSITRERPIFSPSRRPPPSPPGYVAPVAVRQPAKPPEPERPAVSLIGTVVGTDVQIGVFLEKATQNVVRQRLGEEHQGWVLRLVKVREVTLVKDVEQTLVLEPQPGEAPRCAVRPCRRPSLTRSEPLRSSIPRNTLTSSLYPQEARNGSNIDVAVDPAIPS